MDEAVQVASMWKGGVSQPVGALLHAPPGPSWLQRRGAFAEAGAPSRQTAFALKRKSRISSQKYSYACTLSPEFRDA